MVIIGIDLGTTNILACIYQDGKAELIPNALGEYKTSSAIGVLEDDSILVGAAAKERLVFHPESTAALEERLRRPELQRSAMKYLQADAENWDIDPEQEETPAICCCDFRMTRSERTPMCQMCQCCVWVTLFRRVWYIRI